MNTLNVTRHSIIEAAASIKPKPKPMPWTMDWMVPYRIALRELRRNPDRWSAEGLCNYISDMQRCAEAK